MEVQERSSEKCFPRRNWKAKNHVCLQSLSEIPYLRPLIQARLYQKNTTASDKVSRSLVCHPPRALDRCECSRQLEGLKLQNCRFQRKFSNLKNSEFFPKIDLSDSIFFTKLQLEPANLPCQNTPKLCFLSQHHESPTGHPTQRKIDVILSGSIRTFDLKAMWTVKVGLGIS